MVVEEVYGVFLSSWKINNAKFKEDYFFEFTVDVALILFLRIIFMAKIDWEILSLNIIQFPFLIDIMSSFSMSSLIVCPVLFSFHSLGIFSRSIVFAIGETQKEKLREIQTMRKALK